MQLATACQAQVRPVSVDHGLCVTRAHRISALVTKNHFSTANFQSFGPKWSSLTSPRCLRALRTCSEKHARQAINRLPFSMLYLRWMNLVAWLQISCAPSCHRNAALRAPRSFETCLKKLRLFVLCVSCSSKLGYILARCPVFADQLHTDSVQDQLVNARSRNRAVADALVSLRSRLSFLSCFVAIPHSTLCFSTDGKLGPVSSSCDNEFCSVH